MSSNACCNVDKVYTNFTKIQDGRHFTDYRSSHEVDMDFFKHTAKFCNNLNNSYDFIPE